MKRIGVAVVGGGPAGLMAAERAADRGAAVTVFDAMPTVGRKFLLAGRSGLNLTHAEDYDRFVRRYGAALPHLQAALAAFPPDALRAFAADLGQETFVGSSGRVFPRAMKASPMLRAWLRRLADKGVAFRTRHRWAGWDDACRLAFDTPAGPLAVEAAATVLALGGASWPRLGSDAAWVPILEARGVPVAPLAPANCGFDVSWSDVFRERSAGLPVKPVVATVDGTALPGEFVVTHTGIEGSLVYAHAAALRDRLAAGRPAVLSLDLVPGRTAERLARDLSRVDPKQSFSNRLRKGAGLDGVKAALVRECVPDAARLPVEALAAAIKALPLAVAAPRPVAEAISTAGGIAFAGLSDRFELKAIPGVFAAGEMLDWEAPTGGYLLTACFATGRAAGEAAADRALAQ